MPPSPGRGRKRSSSRKKAQRPPPPPPPPPSLVKLLRNDSAVLEYFRSLQENLEADVQIWKDRAQAWEKQVKDLKKELGSSRLTKRTKNDRSKKAHSDGSSSSSASISNSDEEEMIKNRKRNKASSKEKERNTKKQKSTTSPKYKESTKKKEPPPIHDEDIEKEEDIAAFQLEESDESELEDHNDGPPPPASEPKDPEKGKTTKEITDDMLSFPSDSDDESDKEDEDEKQKPESMHARPPGSVLTDTTTLPENPKETGKSNSDDDEDDDDDWDGLSLSGKPKPSKKEASCIDPRAQKYLEEVRSSFDELGVETKNEQDGQRKSDHDVIRDLRFAINSLCRVALTEPELLGEYPPVSNGKLAMVSATNKEHPICEGLRLAFRSVVILDSYTDIWQDSDLQGRHGVYQELVHILQREVRRAWATADRYSRLQQPRAHYHPENEKDGGNAEETAAEDAEVDVRSLPQLSSLLERSCWARFLVALYIARDDLASAKRVILEYILATIPSMKKEEALHPRLPSVLSFVVLEAMLKPSMSELGWKSSENDEGDLDLSYIFSGNDLHEQVNDAYATFLYHAANIWRRRAKSKYSRIRHLASIECAAYDRLCAVCGLNGAKEPTDVTTRLSEIRNILESSLTKNCHLALPYQIALVLDGNLDPSFMKWFPDETLEWNIMRLDSWCRAIRQIYLLELEEVKASVGSKLALNTPPDSFLEECRLQFEWLWELNPFEGLQEKARVLAALIQCAAILADGESVIRYGEEFVDHAKNLSPSEADFASFKPVWDSIQEVVALPMVRVINLQRRHDRWRSVTCQAMAQQFLIVRGLGSVGSSISGGDEEVSLRPTGGYAFDGQLSRSKLLETANFSSAQLAKMIQSDWKPLDLLPFDKDAPRHEKLVSMHQTEIACALSHVACWKACERALALANTSTNDQLPSAGILRLPDRFRCDFLLAGYATGQPLCHEHEGMPPAPVCLVMEDDAQVIDDFRNELEKLLRELPRDFHYCALGYSRPKTAPIVPLPSTHGRIGVPTHLFFATGYLVSAAGLSYLPLPIAGPVDAYLGLLQTENFRNLTGERLGVGGHGRGGKLSRGQLAQLLTFRAFCAVPPLCHQALRSKHVAGAGQRWKDKDTDIVYSGHV